MYLAVERNQAENSYPEYRFVIRREVRNITTLVEFLQQPPGAAKHHQKRGHGEGIPVGGVKGERFGFSECSECKTDRAGRKPEAMYA